MKCSYRLGITLAAVLSGGSILVNTQAPPDISWTAQRLTARVQDAPVGEVLNRIAELTGVLEIVGLERLSGTVSSTFDERPLAEALALILDRFSFALAEHRGRQAGVATTYTLTLMSANGPKPQRSPIYVPALQIFQGASVAGAPADDPDDPDDDQDADEDEDRTELLEMETDGAFAANASLSELLSLLEDHENVLVRRRALEALAGRDPRNTAQPLIQALFDDDEQIVEKSIAILATREDQTTLERLGQALLAAGDRNVRVSVLRVFALNANPACVTFLKGAVNDTDPLVSEAARQLLKEFAVRQRVARLLPGARSSTT